MNSSLKQRQQAFVQLGKILGTVATGTDWPGFECGLTENEWNETQLLINTLHTYNGWFTPQNIRNAMQAWSESLSEPQLEAWLSAYPKLENAAGDKTIALICAGNIPMVGFHDVLSVLISGNKALIKLAQDDNKLIPMVLHWLQSGSSLFENKVAYATGKLEQFHGVIATGSNNSARYFEQYFGQHPHIIRKNRTSVAVIDGTETEEELAALGKDIFAYFGLGCRNVTKLFIPQDFDLDRFFKAIYSFHPIGMHNKYANNYDYNKAVWLLNQEDLIENGFLILKRDDQNLTCPTASLYYQRYQTIEEVQEILNTRQTEIQCVVGHGYIEFGNAQSPKLTDYADGVDTLDFIQSLG
jgi:hypothetical protein